MAEVFVDTSAWYPLVVADHPDHAQVKEATEAVIHAGARLVTSNLVVAETQVLLLHRTNRHVALLFVQTVVLPPMLVLDSSADLERIAVDAWLARFADQTLSLADAVSFVMMQQRGITQALTLDTHFATAGFHMLPATAVARRTRGKRQAVSR
jgi:uncharacterized protein